MTPRATISTAHAEPSPGIQAIGYVRVSSERQAGEKQTSLGDQRTAIERLATTLQVRLTQWFEDAGFSGSTVARRPALSALLAHCAEHRQRKEAPGFVLVLNDSRFGRFADPDEAAALRFRLREHGWIVRFCEADDVQDPSLRHIMRAVGGAQASEMLRNLKANVRRGRDGTARQGFWPGRPPFGFARRVVYPAVHERVLGPGEWKAQKEKVKLVAGAERDVALVRDIFARYTEQGHSITRITEWLRSVGGTTTPRSWGVSDVRAILSNPAYVGGIQVRRRRVTGESGKPLTVPEFVVWDAHEPLIERAQWDQAQALLLQIPQRSRDFDYRVRGLVHCVYCGEAYMGGGTGGKSATVTARHRYYLDNGGRHGKTCGPPVGTVRAHILEAVLIDAVAEHLRSQLMPDVIRQAMARISAPPATRVASRTQQIADVDRRIARLVAAVEQGTLQLQDVGARMHALNDERATLERTSVIDDVRQRAASQVERLAAVANDFTRIASAASGVELRTLLKPWLARATFDRATRRLELHLRQLSYVLLPDVLRASRAATKAPPRVLTSDGLVESAPRQQPTPLRGVVVVSRLVTSSDSARVAEATGGWTGPVADGVLQVLRHDVDTRYRDVVAALKRDRHTVSDALERLRIARKVVRSRRGLWRLAVPSARSAVAS